MAPDALVERERRALREATENATPQETLPYLRPRLITRTASSEIIPTMV